MSAEVIHHNNYNSSTPTDQASSSHYHADLRHPPSQQMPYLTQQYALPVHHPAVQPEGSDGSLDSGEHTPRPENTLRRKTPNGTLNAGYDGGFENANPTKHQLIPLSEGNASGSQVAPSANIKRTFLQHQQRQSNGASSSWNGHSGFGWNAGGFFPPQKTGFPMMDSMLNQMSMQQYGMHPGYGQTVPSVIQPSHQYLGPTASGVQGNGPYGPYWHDGTYVPYRPAALRDPRFYQQPMGGYPGSLPSSQLAQHANLYHQTTFPQAQWAHSLGVHPFASQPHQTLPYGNGAGIQGGIVGGTSGHHPADFTLYGGRQPANESSYRLDEGTLRSTDDVQSEFGSMSPNGRNRDRTFAWALQQYRELLAFIHHTRRQQQQVRHAHGQHHVQQRPSFYPKPPRPSRQGSSLRVKKQRTEPGLQTHSDGLTSGEASDHSENATATDEATPPAHETPVQNPRATSAWTPSDANLHENQYQRRASLQQFERAVPQQWAEQSQPSDDIYRTLRRSSGSQVVSIVSPLPQDNSPPSRAAVALSELTKICQEIDWRWTDGMHLGGCLAYGLGNYQKALKWYTKVLEMDSKHLEATSNLAATLLALGRRQEAEQHWTKVVKAAPNHFEAVEHLIGLLCNEQRSKDAIKVIEYVERCLRRHKSADSLKVSDRQSDCSTSTASRSPCVSDLSDNISYDFDLDGDGFAVDWKDGPGASEPGFGSSGFNIPGSDNGRILALIHAKGNMLYGLGDNGGAARAFEDAVLIAAGRKFHNIQGLVKHILTVVSSNIPYPSYQQPHAKPAAEPILLTPEQALATSKLCFPYYGELPGLQFVPGGHSSLARKAVISTTSNSLLSLAKIFQDGMSNTTRAVGVIPLASGVKDILALYYLSLSLQPSPSTANNVGILLASVQQVAPPAQGQSKMDIPGVTPGSGIALALQYYNYGLQLDNHHAHLYTNLGSLLKDIGQLDAAINMYERAVKCDGKFDIALANLANAVKDKGRISDAIVYYKRAVEVSPEFAEAVCGLANALNSVCAWQNRGGIAEDGGKRDRWHVDANTMLVDAKQPGASSSGWLKRVVDIVERQLVDGETWGRGTLTSPLLEDIVQQLTLLEAGPDGERERKSNLRQALKAWSGQKWEGARVTRLIERATRRIAWHQYQDVHVKKLARPPSTYNRPQLPAALAVPSAPTVLPFHTFTCPMSAKQIRLISQRNGLRISVSTLRAPWLPKRVYPPPDPPLPYLKVGYVSSDFNNHPLAHLMQSVFGLHSRKRVKAFCYATTASDNSIHRQQIQAEAPVFHDASSWSAERLVNQIVTDGIHILVNLNGYTRGARNEVFAARPAPIQMSFMGFAGTLGAEWCDYLLADETAIPPDTLRPWRRNVDVEDQVVDENSGGPNQDWVYGENIIYCRDTFFCCDHRQSAPGAKSTHLTWEEEQKKRWEMRKDLFPQLPDDAIIFGNFNQLYKIEPTTFRTWLRILARVPNSILWLLRFPDLGESHLTTTARQWAGPEVARRVIFTDVAPKHQHISRASICDLVLDTPECNAHTTAADVLWSSTPLLTLPKYAYKMCSRMAASILKGALPKGEQGAQAAKELIAASEDDYEEKAIALGRDLSYARGCDGKGRGRLVDLRHMLYHARRESALFDTRRWVEDLEDAYDEAWRRWVQGEGGDIWLDQLPRRAAAS